MRIVRLWQIGVPTASSKPHSGHDAFTDTYFETVQSLIFVQLSKKSQHTWEENEHSCLKSCQVYQCQKGISHCTVALAEKIEKIRLFYLSFLKYLEFKVQARRRKMRKCPVCFRKRKLCIIYSALQKKNINWRRLLIKLILFHQVVFAIGFAWIIGNFLG